MNNWQETPIAKCRAGRSKLDNTNLWFIKKRPETGSRKREVSIAKGTSLARRKPWHKATYVEEVQKKSAATNKGYRKGTEGVLHN